MKISLRLLVSLAAVGMSANLLNAAEDYAVGPDSKVQPGVPQGELIKFEFTGSKIFPGTSREVTIYVPRQYDPAKPACVYVNQDGVQWSAPTVFDNLIARGELPVIIGVFVRPGVVKSLDAKVSLDRFNRSLEYDGLGDAYARFILDEVLPAVEAKTTTDGRAIHLSHAGNDRAIGGSSSGAIAAFTAAWERPEAFSRVFSVVGTYVGLRGGDGYPTLIRKYEPKPLRVFLQDGSNDNNIYAGDWWMANQTMERALTFSGYDVSHAWGDGAHNGKHGTMLFPDAMRWLWKDWPQPVRAAAPSKNATLAALLIPGEEWQLVSEGHRFTEGPAANAQGEIFFADMTLSKTHRVALDGKVSEFIADTKKSGGQAFGPDGRLYGIAPGTLQILSYGTDGQSKIVAEGFKGNDLVVAHNGNIYVTDPLSVKGETSQIWLIRPDGTKQVVDSGAVRFSNGIALSPDQSLLYVADYRSHWIYSYQVQPDGTLLNRQRYYWLHSPDADDQSYADGMRVDRDGRLYVATRLGIQVCDQAGRVQCILPTPNRRVANVVFGGAAFDTLYATCGDKVYKRRLNTVGTNAWAAPIKPAAPKL
jgi:gluconolactonase